MKHSSRGRTNYSPVRQMNRTFTLTEDDLDPQPQNTRIEQHHLHNNNNNINRSNKLPTSQSRSSVDLQNYEDNHKPPDAEEVYVCNCCGISKEVGPSIQFMPTFKACFFLFNFLVFVGGFANLGMGLWFRIDPKVYEIHKYIETQNFTIAGWIMLFAGFTAILMSLIGFASASRQSAGALVFYFVVMISLTVALVGALVLLTVYGLGTPLERFLVKEIYEQIRRRATNNEIDLYISSDAAQFLDFIQVKMRCCGAANFTDYAKLGMVVPTTCYTIDRNYISAPGCGEAIRRLFDIRAGLAVGFSSASVLVQLFTIILSSLMFCSIYNWRREEEYSRNHQVQSEPKRRIGTPPPLEMYQHQHLHHQRPRSRTPIAVGLEGNYAYTRVVMATNRIDILDPALLRPGRIDFHPQTKRRRVHVTQEDFEMAVAKVMQKDAEKNMSIDKLLN